MMPTVVTVVASRLASLLKTSCRQLWSQAHHPIHQCLKGVEFHLLPLFSSNPRNRNKPTSNLSVHTTLETSNHPLAAFVER